MLRALVLVMLVVGAVMTIKAFTPRDGTLLDIGEGLILFGGIGLVISIER